MGFEERDSLLTVQGFAPKEATDRRKQAPASCIHFSELLSKSASAQAQFFLNAYPNIPESEKRRIYDEWKTFCVIQKEASMNEDGSSIPQNLANLFLQRLGRTMTPTEFKAEFKAVDTNFDGHMAFIEYLVWDFKQGSPAHAIYRPQMQSVGLQNAINGALRAERAFRKYEDDLAEKTKNAETLSGVAGTRAKQELKVFQENTNLAGLNSDIANAYEKLIKARASLTEAGTEYWQNTVQAELDSLKAKKAQSKA